MSWASRSSISINITVKSATPSGAYVTFSTVMPSPSAASRSMWFTPMLRVDRCSTPASRSATSTGAAISDLWPTLTQREPRVAATLLVDTAAPVVVGTIPKRGDSSSNATASSGSHP